MHQSPAEYVITVFGGVRATARALNRTPSTVSKWQKKGEIPTSLMKLIITRAQDRGLDVRPHHLILGNTLD